MNFQKIIVLLVESTTLSRHVTMSPFLHIIPQNDLVSGHSRKCLCQGGIRSKRWFPKEQMNHSSNHLLIFSFCKHLHGSNLNSIWPLWSVVFHENTSNLVNPSLDYKEQICYGSQEGYIEELSRFSKCKNWFCQLLNCESIIFILNIYVPDSSLSEDFRRAVSK